MTDSKNSPQPPSISPAELSVDKPEGGVLQKPAQWPEELWAALPADAKAGAAGVVERLAAANSIVIEVASVRQQMYNLAPEIMSAMPDAEEAWERNREHAKAEADVLSRELDRYMWQAQYELAKIQREADRVDGERKRQADMDMLARQRAQDLATAENNLATAENNRAQDLANTTRSMRGMYAGLGVGLLAIIASTVVSLLAMRGH